MRSRTRSIIGVIVVVLGGVTAGTILFQNFAKPKIDLNYISLILSNYQDSLMMDSTGLNYKKLDKEFVRNIEINYPKTQKAVSSYFRDNKIVPTTICYPNLCPCNASRGSSVYCFAQETQATMSLDDYRSSPPHRYLLSVINDQGKEFELRKRTLETANGLGVEYFVFNADTLVGDRRAKLKIKLLNDSLNREFFFYMWNDSTNLREDKKHGDLLIHNKPVIRKFKKPKIKR